jgi:aminopeptidase N
MSGSIYDYRDFNNYSRDIYVEGSQVLLLLEKEMGQKELKGALQEYYSTYMFKVAGIDDFISICQKYSEKDLSQFFRKYYK